MSIFAAGLLGLHACALNAAEEVPSGSGFVEGASGGDWVHVVVGHSMFLNSASKLKRVYVSNPTVLGSLISTPNEILVTAKAPGVSSLALWDSAGQAKVYSVSADLDVEALRKDLRAALPGSEIAATAMQDRIELSGRVSSQAEAEAALKLSQIYCKDIANSLIVDAPRVKQVQLKVQFAEVDRVKLAQFGVNLFSGGKNTALASTQQFASFGGISTGGSSSSSGASSSSTQLSITDPLNFFLYNQEYNVAIAIQDLEQKQVLQILAEPTITAISGEEASFLSGGEFPFPIVQGGTGNGTAISIQFRPYGVKLVFTPTVNADGTIRLKVAPEVSALDYTNEVQVSGYTVPAIATRRAQTDVELRSGQSFAISGLLDHRLTDALSHTPGIASIPILGQLFRSSNKNVSVAELVVIVTPTIVDPIANPQVVVTPKTVKPYLNTEQFDQQLNKPRKGQQTDGKK